MNLYFFEDELQSRFDPLTLTRPVDQLRMGILTIADKWMKTLSASSISRSTRPILQKVYPPSERNTSSNLVWINSRYLPAQKLVNSIKKLDKQEAIIDSEDDTLIAARSERSDISRLTEEGSYPDVGDFEVTSVQTDRKIRYVWDLFLLNGEEVKRDIQLLNPRRAPTETLSRHVTLYSPENIYLEGDNKLEPGTIIIAEDGPVYVGRGAKIMAGSVIRGPAAICEDSVVKMGAKIYGETTIGPVCKVAGEVNNSIFHSYSNKGHEGFAGNSLFGQWCNLGADTNVSNLKNNYASIDMRDWSTGQPVDSGQQFIGTIMGDHSKTAINTMLNTGTMCGVSCNIFASGFPPKMIPNFSWVGDSGRRVYQFEKALDTMEKMMARRNVALTDAYVSMMKSIFESTHGGNTT